MATCPLCRDWDGNHHGSLSFFLTVTSVELLLLDLACVLLFSFVVTFRSRTRRADFSEDVALSCCSDKLSFWG